MSMTAGRSYTFIHAITRTPGSSVSTGLRFSASGAPDATAFRREHEAYVDALRTAGSVVSVLAPLEEFPDSVFVEDATLCLAGTAIVLRPGAASRVGEAAAIKPDLLALFNRIVDLPGGGTVDGGDIPTTDTYLFADLSVRTNAAGVDALASLVEPLGYRVKE